MAKDIAKWRDDAMFAATPPPLEAARILLSDLATRRRSGDYRKAGQRKALVIGVRKAHLHAFVKRDVYVALPPEVAEPGMCAKLVRSLYGMRGAPANWEELYTATLESFGFVRGRASACCFFHPVRDLRCVVHGDDFTFTGYDEDLAWVEAAMCKAFPCKVGGRLGGGSGDVQELRLLNRVICWTPPGAALRGRPPPRGTAGAGPRAVRRRGSPIPSLEPRPSEGRGGGGGGHPSWA